MAAAQLTTATVSGRCLPLFEGLKPSTVKIAGFVPLRQGLSQRSFRPLVVKAATVVAPKVPSESLLILLFCCCFSWHSSPYVF